MALKRLLARWESALKRKARQAGQSTSEGHRRKEGAAKKGPRGTKTIGSFEPETAERRRAPEKRSTSKENEIRPHYGRDSWPA